MGIWFILWNRIHHSRDLVSGSDDPRCVHSERFLLVLCLLGMSPSFFWALFKCPAIIRVPRLTLYFSCHRLESAISPRIPDSFYWRRYLGSKIWVLGAYTCSSPLLNRHNVSSPALIPNYQLSITCSQPKNQGDRNLMFPVPRRGCNVMNTKHRCHYSSTQCAEPSVVYLPMSCFSNFSLLKIAPRCTPSSLSPWSHSQ